MNNSKVPAHVFAWAKKIKATGAMQALNQKWGGRIPRRGTRKFAEYLADVELAKDKMRQVSPGLEVL